jgi:hypothetical protein
MGSRLEQIRAEVRDTAERLEELLTEMRRLEASERAEQQTPQQRRAAFRVLSGGAVLAALGWIGSQVKKRSGAAAAVGFVSAGALIAAPWAADEDDLPHRAPPVALGPTPGLPPPMLPYLTLPPGVNVSVDRSETAGNGPTPHAEVPEETAVGTAAPVVADIETAPALTQIPTSEVEDEDLTAPEDDVTTENGNGEPTPTPTVSPTTSPTQSPTPTPTATPTSTPTPTEPPNDEDEPPHLVCLSLDLPPVLLDLCLRDPHEFMN